MKSTINYIKNEKEVRKKINVLNFFKIDKEVFESNISLRSLEFKDDIDFVNIKNFSLTGIDEITSNRESLCILDNCFLKKSKYTCSHLRFNEGSYQIINPNFEIKEIKLEGTKDVSMYFDKEDCYEIHGENNYWKYDIENIEIYSNYSVRNLNLEANKIQLYGLFNLSILQINNCEKVIIGSTAQFTKIKLNNFYYSNSIDTKELVLNNCLIVNETNDYLRIDYRKISGENFLIKSKGKVLLNGKIISKARNEQGYIEITLEDIVRHNFIRTLYKVQDEIEKLVMKKANELMSPKFGNHILKEVQNLYKEKEKIQNQIDTLLGEYDTKKEVKQNKLIKQLTRKPINNLYK